MTITKTVEGDKLAFTVSGRLDSLTAPALEAAFRDALEGVRELVFDLSGLEYISSAGLRVLLLAQKIMDRQGRMTVLHAGETLMEVFEVTGFVDILTIV